MFFALLALLSIGAAAGAESAGSMTSGMQAPVPGWRPPIWRQVHIEQHLSIRITPGPVSMPRAMIAELEEQDRVERVDERKLGKCLGITSIAAVHPGDGDELLLFLRDERVISAKLQKRCSARDFYSGFYVDANADGAICTGRDILHSRSGDNCKVRRLHELVPAGFRRFP